MLKKEVRHKRMGAKNKNIKNTIKGKPSSKPKAHGLLKPKFKVDTRTKLKPPAVKESVKNKITTKSTKLKKIIPGLVSEYQKIIDVILSQMTPYVILGFEIESYSPELKKNIITQFKSYEFQIKYTLANKLIAGYYLLEDRDNFKLFPHTFNKAEGLGEDQKLFDAMFDISEAIPYIEVGQQTYEFQIKYSTNNELVAGYYLLKKPEPVIKSQIDDDQQIIVRDPLMRTAECDNLSDLSLSIIELKKMINSMLWDLSNIKKVEEEESE
jgi:hypothetical protein